MFLKERIIVDTNQIENMLVEPIDYTITNKIISDETHKDLSYLKDNLNNA
jgi:hypothetical protein